MLITKSQNLVTQNRVFYYFLILIYQLVTVKAKACENAQLVQLNLKIPDVPNILTLPQNMVLFQSRVINVLLAKNQAIHFCYPIKIIYTELVLATYHHPVQAGNIENWLKLHLRNVLGQVLLAFYVQPLH